MLGAKARAVMEGRIHVSCRDVRDAAVPVLRHRILVNYKAEAEGVSVGQVIGRLVETVSPTLG